MNILGKFLTLIRRGEAEPESVGLAATTLRELIVRDLEAAAGAAGTPDFVPRGTFVTIARRRGCTTAWVGKIAKDEGYYVAAGGE